MFCMIMPFQEDKALAQRITWQPCYAGTCHYWSGDLFRLRCIMSPSRMVWVRGNSVSHDISEVVVPNFAVLRAKMAKCPLLKHGGFSELAVQFFCPGSCRSYSIMTLRALSLFLCHIWELSK